MPTASISQTASEKLIREKNGRSQLLGLPVIPRLYYYQRSYTKLAEGCTIEYGPGFTLSFIEGSKPWDDQWMLVELGEDSILLVGPATLFQTGRHTINWVDRKFTLSTVDC